MRRPASIGQLLRAVLPTGRRLRGLGLLAILLAAACGSDEPATTGADAARGDAGDAGKVDLPLSATDTLPVPAQIGAACIADSDCQTGVCAQGVCCSSHCVGSCRRCDLPDQLGQCRLLPVNSPCGGNLCKDFATFLPQATCDSTGDCIAGPAIACAPARCLDDACVAACTRDDQCEPLATCLAGSCRRSTPAACSKPEECASGFCQQGVCCERACTSACESCNLPASRGKCSPIPACTADAAPDAPADASPDLDASDASPDPDAADASPDPG